MGEITLRKALDDYKTIQMSYRNFAERTREEYQNDLEDFILFVNQVSIKQVRELGLPIIERLVAHLEEKGFASLTRKRKVVTIRSFLSFLYRDGYIDINIAKYWLLGATLDYDHCTVDVHCVNMLNKPLKLIVKKSKRYIFFP